MWKGPKHLITIMKISSYQPFNNRRMHILCMSCGVIFVTFSFSCYSHLITDEYSIRNLIHSHSTYTKSKTTIWIILLIYLQVFTPHLNFGKWTHMNPSRIHQGLYLQWLISCLCKCIVLICKSSAGYVAICVKIYPTRQRQGVDRRKSLVPCLTSHLPTQCQWV